MKGENQVSSGKLYLPIVTEDDNTNIISFQVEGHTLDTGAELNHLTSLDLGKTEDSSNTITNWDHSTEFFQVILILNMDGQGSSCFMILQPKFGCTLDKKVFQIW